MAQMIQDRFSSEKHIDAGERHVRLCNRTPSAVFLAQDIQSAIDGLLNAKKAVETKEKERKYAYDAVMLSDGYLDNIVQDCFEGCKKFDRESGSATVLTQIFPTGRLGDVKEAPVMEEPRMVKEIIERLKSLGSAHPLFAFIEKLEAKVTDSENAIKAYDSLGNELGSLKVQEEIAQRKLREQYSLNYLHAQEKLGKPTAELVFPVFSGS